MASRRGAAQQAAAAAAAAAGPSRSTAAHRAHQHAPPPITAYGAPAAHIDQNAIGFDGIRSLHASAAGFPAAPAPAGGVQPRSLQDLLALNLTLEEENKLPRSERNILRVYRNENNIPRTAPLVGATVQQSTQPQPRIRASATAPLTRTPRLGRDLAAAGNGIGNGGAQPHLAELPVVGMAISDLVPNANGSGAQRRDPFPGPTSLRSGTNTNVLNATIAHQTMAAAHEMNLYSRSGSGSRSRSAGSGSAAARGALDLSYKQQQHINGAGEQRLGLHGIALGAPPNSSSANSDAESEGQLQRRRANARARAAEEGVVIPDSSSSNMSLSPSARGGRRGRQAAAAGSEDGHDEDDEDEDEEDGDSESASEGQKHTRTIFSPSSRRMQNGIPGTPRSIMKTRSRTQDGKKKAAAAEEEEEEELADKTIQAGPSGGVQQTPGRSKGRSAQAGQAADDAPANSGAPDAGKFAGRTSGSGWFAPIGLFFLFMLATLATQMVLRVVDPFALMQHYGLPVPDALLPPVPPSYHQQQQQQQQHKSIGKPASAPPLPSDLVRTAALDSVSKKLDKLSREHRRDKSALDKVQAELAQKFGIAEDDMEKILFQLREVSGRVDAVEKKVKDVSAAAAAAAAASSYRGKKSADVVTFADLRRYHADQTGREDLANPAAGARLVHDLTTWDAWWGGTYGTRPKVGLASFFSSRLAGSAAMRAGGANPNAHSPQWALMPASQPGHCWQFPGDQAQLGISLVRPAHIGAFSIEHVQRELVPDRKSAPRAVELWGIVDAGNQEAMTELREWRTRMAHERLAAQREAEGAPPNSINAEWEAWRAEEGDEPQPTPPADNYVLLGTHVYDLDAAEVQTVEIRRSAKRLGVKLDTVQFRFRGNYGAENTCVYRVRVHPEPARAGDAAA